MMNNAFKYAKLSDDLVQIIMYAHRTSQVAKRIETNKGSHVRQKPKSVCWIMLSHFWVTFAYIDATFWLVCARFLLKSVWIAGLRTWSKRTPNMKIWLSHVPHSKPRTPRRMHISSRPLTLTKFIFPCLKRGLLKAMATELKNCLV